MSVLGLKAAAEILHLNQNELKHVAQRGEIDAFLRNGEWFFRRRDVEEWMQRHLIAAKAKELMECHKSMIDETRRLGRDSFGLVSRYLKADCIELFLSAKAKAGVLRDMTDIATNAGYVYDDEALFKALVEREEVASTAIGEGAAFLHPRYHDPYLFAESFIAYARTERPIFFGAPDGGATRHFFLICAADREIHLHILARLAMLAHGSDFFEKLDAAETPEDVLLTVADSEAEFIQ
jgi:mannitol/fructose-specific phosphotransferase system IIA component (Ntr-type)